MPFAGVPGLKLIPDSQGDIKIKIIRKAIVADNTYFRSEIHR